MVMSQYAIVNLFRGWQSLHLGMYYYSGQGFGKALYNVIMGVYIKDCFDPKRIRLIDFHKDSYLFRGNVPIIDGSFAYDQLKLSLNDVAIQNNHNLPDQYTLVIISLLNYRDDPEAISPEEYGIS